MRRINLNNESLNNDLVTVIHTNYYVVLKHGTDIAYLVRYRDNRCGLCHNIDDDRIIGDSSAAEYMSSNLDGDFNFNSSWGLRTRKYTLKDDGSFEYRNYTVGEILENIKNETGYEFEFALPTEGVIIEEDYTDFISPLYETDITYSGQHVYHDSHSYAFNKPVTNPYPYRIGVELEVEFNNDRLRRKFVNLNSNWFTRERDGSLNEYGVEIITVPLNPDDAKSEDLWKPLTDYLRGKATSWDNGNCGLHVHIGREILGNNGEESSETLGKLLYFYHHFLKDTSLNTSIYGRSRAYSDHDGKSNLSRSVEEIESEMEDKTLLRRDMKLMKKVGQSMIAKSSETRYFDINTENSATIEFRRGKGSINPSRIRSIVEYSEKLVLYAKQAKWDSIGYDDFFSWMKDNVLQDSPLYGYFNGGTTVPLG